MIHLHDGARRTGAHRQVSWVQPTPDVRLCGRSRLQRDADWRSSAKDENAELSKMISEMLKGKALRDGFRDKVDKIVDVMGEEKVGYWALVLHVMSVADIGSWCESAADTLKELLKSMHLNGGGQGRGGTIG